MIQSRYFCTLALVALALSVTTSLNAQPTRAAVPGVPLAGARVPAPVAALAKKMAGTASDVPAVVFATPAPNVYGVAVEREKHVQVFYTDRDAKTLFVGMMFDVVGKQDVGSTFISNHMPGRVDLAAAMRGGEKRPLTTESLDRAATDDEIRTVAMAEGFTTATSGAPGSKAIYALIDPNCGFCANAWAGLSAMKEAKLNGYRIRWVPMTIGGDDGQVATMLGDEGSRFAATNAAMTAVRRGVPVAAAPAVADGELSLSMTRAKTNREIVQKLNIAATPTFFVEAKPGRFVRREGYSTIEALMAALPSDVAGGGKQ